ncbi:MAG: hypothetical protein GY862_18880, partial [Gammaproteobacteria bacterium]|nr:hypothetical protein [Gammaproteobacteria bacterium]
ARLDPAWRYVVLIDDVITSGRTVREIAKIFVQAGVQRVDVWCCARRMKDWQSSPGKDDFEL